MISLEQDLKKIEWAFLLPFFLLLLAIPSGLPYIFYIGLRWAVSVSALVILYKFYLHKKIIWCLVFGAIAILFNPIFPITLSKLEWIPIDLVVAFTFFLTLIKFSKENPLKVRKDSKKSDSLFVFALVGYLLIQIFNSDIGFALLGAFLGAWVAVFFDTYVRKI